MTPYYDDGTATIYHGDCRDVLNGLYVNDAWGGGECVVVDPPWDDVELLDFVTASIASDFESLLVFTDGRRIGETMQRFGPARWLFVWDTMNSWSVSPHLPVQQTKHCCWYGGNYERDAELWGEAPPARNHPSTRQVPLDGRRLTDLYSESLRWLHNPSAGEGSAGTERFGTRQGDPVLRHAKPVAWLRMLIGNTSYGPVLDPFMGSGTTLRAAKDLGRDAIGIDTDERCCEVAARRLAQEVLPIEWTMMEPVRLPPVGHVLPGDGILP